MVQSGLVTVRESIKRKLPGRDGMACWLFGAIAPRTQSYVSDLCLSLPQRSPQPRIRRSHRHPGLSPPIGHQPFAHAAMPSVLGLMLRRAYRLLSEVVPVYAAPDQDVCGVDTVAAQRSNRSLLVLKAAPTRRCVLGLRRRQCSGNAPTTLGNAHKTPAAATAKTPGYGLEITPVKRG